MSELDDLVNLAKTRSRDVIEMGMEHDTILMALTPKGVHIIKIEFSEKAKVIFSPALATLLKSINAYAYVLINEAWMTKIDPSSQIYKELSDGKKQVRDLPPDDKCEVVMITEAVKNRYINQYVAEIKYTPNYKRYLDDNWKKSPDEPIGRMVIKEW